MIEKIHTDLEDDSFTLENLVARIPIVCQCYEFFHAIESFRCQTLANISRLAI